MEGSISRPRSSELSSHDDPMHFDEHRDTTSLDSMAVMSKEWTDEKHSLYLKSMEASFVNDLYNSMDLLGWRSQKDSWSNSNSSFNMHATSSSAGQYKVQRDSCWNKINFRKNESQLHEADECCVLLANPWIRHFRSSCQHHIVTSPILQRNDELENQTVPSKGKEVISHGLAGTSQQFNEFHRHFCCQDSVGSNAEVSDQNFVNEDIEEEKANSGFITKRMRTLEEDASNNDQVVPFGRLLTTDVTEDPFSIRK